MSDAEGPRVVSKEVRQQAMLEDLRAIGDEATTDGKISATLSADYLLRAVDVLEAQIHDEVRATLLNNKDAQLALDPKALTGLRDIAQARGSLVVYSTNFSTMLSRFDKN